MIVANQNGRPTISGIWETYRLKITGTMCLLAVERMLGVAVPFVLGVAINDLIDDNLRGIWFELSKPINPVANFLFHHRQRRRTCFQRKIMKFANIERISQRNFGFPA